MSLRKIILGIAFIGTMACAGVQDVNVKPAYTPAKNSFLQKARESYGNLKYKNDKLKEELEDTFQKLDYLVATEDTEGEATCEPQLTQGLASVACEKKIGDIEIYYEASEQGDCVIFIRTKKGKDWETGVDFFNEKCDEKVEDLTWIYENELYFNFEYFRENEQKFFEETIDHFFEKIKKEMIK